VRQGGLRDAILHSASANATHGLRRTNDDKRRAVLMLLQDEEWGKWTAREIARCCAVSHDFVSRLRGSLSSDDSEPASRTYRDRHGNVTQMDTARIGRRPAEPEPDQPAADSAPTPDAPEQQPSNVIQMGDRLLGDPSPAIAVLGQGVVIDGQQPSQQVSAIAVAQIANGPTRGSMGVLCPCLGEQPAGRLIQGVAGQYLISLAKHGLTPAEHRPLGPAPICSRGGGASDLTSGGPIRDLAHGCGARVRLAVRQQGRRGSVSEQAAQQSEGQAHQLYG